MLARRSLLALWFGPWLCIVAGGGCDRIDRERMARSVVAWPIGQASFELAPHARIRLETRNLSPHALAVLSVWDVSAKTEVASAEGSRWFARTARLDYRNESAKPRSLQLLVRAAGDAWRGTADVYRDGAPWLRGVSVGGTQLHMLSGLGVVHQVAAVPGGPQKAWLLALDLYGRMVALDEHSGPTRLPKLAGGLDVDTLVLASGEGGPGAFQVYSNDTGDRDGDGLGHRLERALRTCDAPEQPGCGGSSLSAYYRQVGTRDTDRDGIADADELFGVSAPALDLPRFGADPRHKDVFVEIDHDARLESIGFSESELVDIAALFGAGSAQTLRNPDGMAGVRVHFDAGFVPQSAAHSAIFGAFGGSGRSSASEYRAARQRDFTPDRSGYFRYAFSTRRGRGQAHGDAFTVNRDLARVTIFAHELGHTLGLSHHGHDSWGRVNCKPNYRSIMNYLYQQRYEVGFAQGSARELNPAAVLERQAASRVLRRRAAWPSLLREPPFELEVLGRDVDWNRDGKISDEHVRAGLTWGTYKSCGAGEFGITLLAERDVAAATPVLIRLGGALYALWLDAHGRVSWRRATGSLAALRERGDAATVWSPARALSLWQGARHIAATMLPDGAAALAAVREDGAVELTTLTITQEGLTASAAIELAGVRTQHAPSLSFQDVDAARYGAKHLLQLVFREAGPEGALAAASAEGPSGPFVVRRLVDARGQTLTSAGAPSLIALPTGETCGVWTDGEGFTRFFSYDTGTDRFRDFSSQAFAAGLGPRSGGPVGLAFHRYRNALGVPIAGDLGRGALYMTFTEPPAPRSAHADNPHVFVSEWLNAQGRADAQIALRWRGRLINEWYLLAPGTGVALLEDREEPALRGLMAVRDEAHGGVRLEFLPHADGEFDAPLRAGDDFAVMERGICLGLHDAAACGDASTAAY